MTPKPLVKKEFRVKGVDIIKNRQPLDSFAVAHLFYGVPRNMNAYRQEPGSNDVIFFEDKGYL
jgi:hypothetical protein